MSRRRELDGSELPLAVKGAIDRICIDFEDRWRAGEEPRAEDFLADFSAAARAALLRELLLVELAYLGQQGPTPSREQYERRFPDDADVIAAVFLPAPARSPVYNAGARIGPYLIERLLGSGSFGEVYLATDTQHERRLAIKVPAGDCFESPEAVEHFLEEARTARKLRHPGIIRAWDVRRDADGRPLIVMQYIPGRSLRERLHEERLPRSEAIELLVQVAEAVDYAHRQGIVHRDLEPGNILLDQQNRPHISDFGLALDERTQETRAGESAGSLAYMSPEQIRGESHWLDGRADVWALGVILYELLAGRRPFVASDAERLASQILGRDPKPLRQIDGDIPAELERICLKCLAKPVADRYATARDLADDLRRAAVPGRGATSGTADASFVAHPMAMSSTVPAVLGALLAGIVVGAMMLGVDQRRAPWSSAAPQPARHATAMRGPLEAPQQVVIDDIELAVWVPEAEYDRRRGEISKHASSAAPLRVGDKIRLSVSLNERAYIYILWLDPDARLLPIYPWRDGDWQQGQEDLPAVDRLELPSASSTWPIEPGPAGVATVFIFAARRRLPDPSAIAALLPPLAPQLGAGSDLVYWFEDGREIRLPGRKARGPGLRHASALADPILLNQQRVFEHLGGLFEGNAALGVPIAAP